MDRASYYDTSRRRVIWFSIYAFDNNHKIDFTAWVYNINNEVFTEMTNNFTTAYNYDIIWHTLTT